VKKLWIFLSTLLALSASLQPAQADTRSAPSVASFTMSPDSVDLATGNSTITFDLIINNDTGIFSTSDLVTVTDGGSNSFVTRLNRTDTPVNTSLQRVEFKGTYVITNTLATGVYSATAAPIVGATAGGSPGISTQEIVATTSSKVVGAENSLLIRNNGYLDFTYKTFVGPTFNTYLAIGYKNPKYNSATAPVWKVGETFNPSDYYELEVPTLTLKVKTNTPRVCSSDGKVVTLIGEGDCSFVVYTDRTLDYQSKQDAVNAKVLPGRSKPTLTVGTVSTQSSSVLPLSIPGPLVYSPSTELVIPVSATPSVCYPVGSYITVISGGTCTLNYSTSASTNYLASDIFPLTFQITRSAQTITFSLPTTATLASKTLSLSGSSSSGLPLTYTSMSSSNCSVTGNSLNLFAPGSCIVKADQVGSATIAPASMSQTLLITGSPQVAQKKANGMLTCVKNGKSRTVVGDKCPAGYSVKKVKKGN